MGFFLLDNPQPNTQQWGYPRRGSRLSGTCIMHTAECALDNIGPDTSAEGTAAFIKNRIDHGSYHCLVDSDSIIWMAPWEYETWQDLMTNPWAVGISAAVQADNWHLIPADRKDRIYRNLAICAADFVKYMKSAYGVTVPLKRITGAQARAGVPGFCAHGDSGVDRHDPGVQFNWTLFFEYTKKALAGTITNAGTIINQEDELTKEQFDDLRAILVETQVRATVARDNAAKAVAIATENQARITENQRRITETREIVKQIGAAAGANVDYDRIDKIVDSSLAAGVKVDISFGGAKAAAPVAAKPPAAAKPATPAAK